MVLKERVKGQSKEAHDESQRREDDGYDGEARDSDAENEAQVRIPDADMCPLQSQLILHSLFNPIHVPVEVRHPLLILG